MRPRILVASSALHLVRLGLVPQLAEAVLLFPAFKMPFPGHMATAVLGICVVGTQALAGTPVLGSRQASRCDRTVLSSGLPSGVRVVTASTAGPQADDTYLMQQTKQPGLCRVEVEITAPSPTNTIRLGVYLPTKERWNSRMITFGNYAFYGGIKWDALVAGAFGGFAALSIDTGHALLPADLTFALDAGKQLDWGQRAMQLSVPLTKRLVNSYYSRPTNTTVKSYYSGCSTGGRQGLREAMVDPSAFDAMLIGSPAWDFDHLMSRAAMVGDFNLQVASNQRLQLQASFNLIAAQVAAQCDVVGFDNVRDNITSDVDACYLAFNWDAIPKCPNDAQPQPSCLTRTQLDIAKKMATDGVIDGSTFVYEGYSLPSAFGWISFLGGSAPSGFDLDYVRYFQGHSDWRWATHKTQIMAQANNAAARARSGATADDFAALAAWPGKLLLYHGLADHTIPAKGSRRLWDGLRVKANARFFEVPGMQHCGNGGDEVKTTGARAPWYLGGIGLQDATARGSGGVRERRYAMPPAAGLNDTRHDALQALLRWAEPELGGVPPADLVVTAFVDQTASGEPAWYQVYRQRLICPYPQHAELTDPSRVNDVAAWRCVS